MKNEDFKDCTPSKNFQILSPKINLQSPEKLFINCDNIKNVNKNGLEISHKNSNENDLFTPPKLSNDLFDSSMLNEDEVVKILYDTDNILNLNNTQLMNDSILNYSPLNENFNNEKSNENSPVDPLSLDNEITMEMKTISPDKSKLRKHLNYNSDSESDDFSFYEEEIMEGSKEEDDDEEKEEYDDEEEEEEEEKEEDDDDEEAKELLEKLFKTQEENSKKEILSSETIQKLNKLVVKLTHVVPPQHKVENSSGSRTLSRKEWKAFEKFSKRIRSKFNNNEDMIIKQNWKLFCKIHEWDENDVQPFLCMKHQGKIYITSSLERKKFVQFLAKGLPYRTLYSVYHRFRFLFSNFSFRGRYTSEEDKKIMVFMNCPKTDKLKKIRELSKILSRTHKSIFKRYKKLVNIKSNTNGKNKRKSESKVVWTLDLIELFLENFLKVTRSKNIKQLKNQKFPQVIWKEMEKRMDIEINALKYFWFAKLHLQLFSPDPIYLNDIKIKLIEFLQSSEITNEKEIKWNEMLNSFDGMTVFFLCDMTYRILKRTKSNNESKNFTECVNYLYKNMIPQLEINREDKYLPRLCYENKKLTFLDDNGKTESNESLKDDNKLFLKRQIKSKRNTRNLNKSKIDCTTKNQNLIWTISLREKFLKTLLKLMISDDIEELKHAFIPKVVWEELSKNLHIHRNELENLWYNELHMQLYSPSPIYLNDLKLQLIEIIYGKQLKKEDEIDWEDIGSSFDGITTNFLSLLFHDLIDDAKEKIKVSNFSEIMKYLYEKKFLELKNRKDDKFLPRIIFENERIKVMDENIENEEICTSEEDCKNEIANYSEIHWTMDFRENFIKLLLRLNLDTRIEELKDAEIQTVVWMEMEKYLKIDKSILQDLWYKELHLQLFSSGPIYLNDIKMILIELIYKRQITDEKEINWNEICVHFDGMTEIFLSQLFADLVDFASKEIDSSKFSEIMKYLKNTMFSKLQEEKVEKFLPRINFENDRIKIIDDKIENVTCKSEKNSESEIINDKEAFWTVSMREEFLKYLLRLNLCTRIEELNCLEIPNVVWMEMEKQFKIDKNILQDLWYKELHMQLFSSNSIYYNDIKMILIELIYKSELKDQNDINWSEICSRYDGMTKTFLSHVFQELVDTASKVIDSKQFSDIIKYLYEKTFNELKTVPLDKMLPQIIYDNGKISIVTRKTENGLN